MNRISRIFQPSLVIPKNATVKHQDITSKSQRLMLEQGLIRQAGNGTFYLLPLLQRSLRKASALIDRHMRRIGAERVVLPTLTSADLWKKSGRLQSAATATELLKTTDRHGKVQILGPTHEEAITSLMAAISPVTYRQFPLRLYQISTKFRDEMKPRFGLMRAKEFLMKDLYTFDVGLAEARQTYEEVNEAYQQLFESIGIAFAKVSGDSGAMGGSVSHEYHFLSAVGEDHLAICSSCGAGRNEELLQEKDATKCSSCGCANVEHKTGIEVAHTFILEDKYTKALGAQCLQPNGKPSPLQMGCYGIGVTRLIAGAIEVLSSDSEIRWPLAVAPYRVCLIPPKAGSKEEAKAGVWTELLYRALTEVPGFVDEVLVDDRCQLTIGKRLLDAKKTGYPLVVVIGSRAMFERNEAKFEVLNLLQQREQQLNFDETLSEVANVFKAIT